MTAQYADVKARHPGMLILFRMGDFYEAFEDDAKTLASTCKLALTYRNKTVPMAGFPHHSLEIRLRELLRSGQRVAICEPVEEVPPGRKVERAVVGKGW